MNVVVNVNVCETLRLKYYKLIKLIKLIFKLQAAIKNTNIKAV